VKSCWQPEFVNPCFGLAPGPHLALIELELGWSPELGFAPGSVLQYQNLTVLGFAPASVLLYQNLTVLGFAPASVLQYQNLTVLGSVSASVLQYPNLTVLGSVSASVLNLGLFGVEIGIG